MDVLTPLWEVVVISTHKALKRVCKHTHKRIHKYPVVSEKQGNDWTLSNWFTGIFSSESYICDSVIPKIKWLVEERFAVTFLVIRFVSYVWEMVNREDFVSFQ